MVLLVSVVSVVEAQDLLQDLLDLLLDQVVLEVWRVSGESLKMSWNFVKSWLSSPHLHSLAAGLWAGAPGWRLVLGSSWAEAPGPDWVTLISVSAIVSSAHHTTMAQVAVAASSKLLTGGRKQKFMLHWHFWEIPRFVEKQISCYFSWVLNINCSSWSM